MRHVGLVRVAALVGAGALSVATAVGVASALPRSAPRPALAAADPTPTEAAAAAPGKATVACEPTFSVPAVGPSMDLFLRIDAIHGESTDGQHRGEIDLQSVHGGVSGPGSGHCGAAAKTAGLGSLSLTKSLDLASVRLLRDSLTGHVEPKATIVARTRAANPREALKIVLTGVRIQSVRDVLTGDGAGEQVLLGFARVEWTYTPPGDPTAVVKLCWDVAADRTC